MADVRTQLEVAVRNALAPTWAEVVRAKALLRRLLSDGHPHGIRELQTCLLEADGVVPVFLRREKIQLSSHDDIQSVVTPSNPAIAQHRLALAATEALVDLVALGMVIEVSKAPDPTFAHPIVDGGDISVQYQLGGLGAGVSYETSLPNLAAAYRLAPRLAADETQWFFDPDLLTSDLADLRLESRTRRCLTEALVAYRRGVFLGCASLLGAASEGAWYAAGEQLRHLDAQLAKALDDDNTSKVLSRVSEVLRQVSRLRAVVEDLQAQAALLRQLRNYGVHPRTNENEHLERYFSESGAAVLLLETQSYLNRLTGAVVGRLEAESTASDH